MMKQTTLKIFAVLLALVMLFALASCGGKDKEKDNSETTDTHILCYRNGKGRNYRHSGKYR